MDSFVEEAFQVENYNPLGGGWLSWKSTDRVGNDLLECIYDDTLGFLPSVVLKAGWIWSHSWIIDSNYAACDEEGWCYASSLNRLNVHLASGKTKGMKQGHHFIRRRRWIRTRVQSTKMKLKASQKTTSLIATMSVVQKDKQDTPSEPRILIQISRDSAFSHIFHGRSADTTSFLHLEFDSNDIVKEGWLGKRGSYRKNWRMRYFILRRDTNSLIYLKDRKHLVQLGEVYINGHTSVVAEPGENSQQSVFVVLNADRHFRLSASDAAARSEWMSAISEMIVQCRDSFLETDETTEDMGEECKPGMVWRPYELSCSTSHRKVSHTLRFYQTLHVEFLTDLVDICIETRDSVLSNIDSLEGSIRETVAKTSTQLTTKMLHELESLRKKVIVSSKEHERRIQSALTSPVECLFITNRLKRDLYIEAKQWIDYLVTRAQVTLKPVQKTSPKGRIPLQWFDTSCELPRDLKRPNLKSSRSLNSQVSDSDDDSTSEGEKQPRQHSISSISASLNASLNSAFRPSFDSVMMMNAKVVGAFGKKKKRPNSAGKIRGGVPDVGIELPCRLTAGHPELPLGLGNLVVLVQDKDYGSVIAFTLCSKAYAYELQTQHPHLEISFGFMQERNMKSAPMELKGRSIPEHLGILRSNAPRHIDLDFAYDSGPTKHYVRSVAFFASQFHALRHLIYPGNLGYLESLANCRIFTAKGGKSGAGFSRTADERLILKEIPLSEFNMFVHMAPAYFEYMSGVMEKNTPTAMSKILGLYKITRSQNGNKKTAYVIVMENLLMGCAVSQLYDLKGLVRRRYVETTKSDDAETLKKGTGTVLQDGNFMDRIPVPVLQSDLNIFHAAIEKDTELLCSLGVIDYSLVRINTILHIFFNLLT